MAHRDALMDEVRRRVPDPFSAPAPLATMGFRVHGPYLDEDGTLRVSIDETDALGRKRSHTLWQDLNGRLRQMPPEKNEGPMLVPFATGRLRPSPRRDADKLTQLAKGHLGESAGAAWAQFLRRAVRLVHARDAEPIVAQLGGLPAPLWNR